MYKTKHVYIYNLHFFDTKIYNKWRMFLHAVFRSHVKLSKESLMSNFPSNNIRLPSRGMDTQHVYQFNVRFYQNPSRDYTYSIFLLLKSQRHRFAIHWMSPKWRNGKTFTFMLRSGLTHWMFFFIFWNAAHWWAPMVWCLQLSFFQKAMVIPGSSHSVFF